VNKEWDLLFDIVETVNRYKQFETLHQAKVFHRYLKLAKSVVFKIIMSGSIRDTLIVICMDVRDWIDCGAVTDYPNNWFRRLQEVKNATN